MEASIWGTGNLFFFLVRFSKAIRAGSKHCYFSFELNNGESSSLFQGKMPTLVNRYWSCIHETSQHQALLITAVTPADRISVNIKHRTAGSSGSEEQARVVKHAQWSKTQHKMTSQPNLKKPKATWRKLTQDKQM